MSPTCHSYLAPSTPPFTLHPTTLLVCRNSSAAALYSPVASSARDYHNMAWDVLHPQDNPKYNTMATTGRWNLGQRVLRDGAVCCRMARWVAGWGVVLRDGAVC